MTPGFQARVNALIARCIARGELLPPSGLRPVPGKPGYYRLVFQVPFSDRRLKCRVEETVLFECRVKGAFVAEGKLEDHGDSLRSAFLVRTLDLAK